MLYRIIFLTLLTPVVAAQNKDDEDKKRPSWSQGIPERKATPKLGVPEFDPTTPEINLQPESTAAEQTEAFSVETIAPVLEQPKPTLPARPVVEEPAAETSTYQTQAETSPEDVTPVTVEAQPVTVSSAPQLLSSGMSYDWQIVYQQPVQVPASLMADQSSVLLKISINVRGEVIDVETVQNDTPGSLLNHAKKSISRWRFVSPREQGINEAILSKVFEIYLTAKT